MQADHASELVRAAFSAFASRDRAAIERLLADDFTFTSPNDDDHISRAAYFENCWPGGDLIHSFRTLDLVENGGDVLIRYEAERKDGTRFRNMEWFRTEGGKIKAEEVYFGRSV